MQMNPLHTLPADRAASHIFRCTTYLAGVARDGDTDRHCLSYAAAILRELQSHRSPVIHTAARRACMRFGITAPVAVSMGDRA